MYAWIICWQSIVLKFGLNQLQKLILVFMHESHFEDRFFRHSLLEHKITTVIWSYAWSYLEHMLFWNWALVHFDNTIFSMNHIMKIDASEIEFKHIVKTWYRYSCMVHFWNTRFLKSSVCKLWRYKADIYEWNIFSMLTFLKFNCIYFQGHYNDIDAWIICRQSVFPGVEFNKCQTLVLVFMHASYLETQSEVDW